MMFHLDFHTSTQDESDHTRTRYPMRGTIFNDVNFDIHGNGIFEEFSNVILWQFYDINWKNKVNIVARVKPDLPVTSLMTILSDGDCATFDVHPSIFIALESGPTPESVRVLFGISLEKKDHMIFINVTTVVSEIHTHLIIIKLGLDDLNNLERYLKTHS